MEVTKLQHLYLVVELTSSVTNVESWNGSSWTEVGEINTARNYGAGGSPDSTNFIAAGGFSPPTQILVQKHWNGTSWTEVNDLSTARYGSGGGASSGALL